MSEEIEVNNEVQENTRGQSRPYNIYKPNKSGSGCASRFQIVTYFNKRGKQRVVIFVDIAPQIESKTENAAFGWQEKERCITVQLDDNDISDLLLVLIGAKDSAGTGKGLYHKNPKGNTVIKLDHSDKGLFFGLSAQRDGQNVRLGHSLTPNEAIILAEIFKAYFVLKYGNVY